MMINRMAWTLAVGLVALVAWPALGDDDDEKIDLAKVPAVVKAAAMKALPGSTWSKASKETEKGKTIYELSGKNADGDEVEVEVTADGKILEIERDIDVKDAPKAAVDAFRAKYPDRKISGVEEVSKDGKVIGYDFESKVGAKEEEVRVSPDGKHLKVEEDEDEKD